MSNKLIKKHSSDNKLNDGCELYYLYGKTFIVCGIVSFALLVYVSMLPQDYEKYNIPLCFTIWSVISFVLLVLGIVIIILVRKSKKFQMWADRDMLRLGEWLMKRENKRRKG